MQINIRPDKKLYTKYIYTYLTSVAFLFFISVLLQFLIPLKKTISTDQVAIVIWPIFFGFTILTAILVLTLSKLWMNNLSFIIDTDRIIIRKGIISKIEQNIPFRAITDFMLHRTLYDRILGIASIRIQTAGQSVNASGYEGSLTGLVNYSNLYKELRERLKRENQIESTGEDKLTNLSTGDLLTKVLMELTTIREIMETNRK